MLVALGTVLTVGLGPIAALLVFWLGGLAATLALAIDFARNAGTAAIHEGSGHISKTHDGS